MLKIIATFCMVTIIVFAQAQNIPSEKNIDAIKPRVVLSADGQIDPRTFRFLKKELSNAEIILLGEPLHKEEYYATKIQLIKFLHEEMGFDVLAFESGFYSMHVVNEQINNGVAIAEAFQRGLFPVWTETEDFEKLYPYLERERKGLHPFEIAGFDCQISATNSSTYFIAAFRNALDKEGISYKNETLAMIQKQLLNLEQATGLSPDFSEETMQDIRRLQQKISTIKNLETYAETLRGWIGHFGDLFYNHLLERIKNGNLDTNPRDSLMAQHLLYLHRIKYPGQKIIAWGANLHFANDLRHLDTRLVESKNVRPMGYHLKKELGDKVFSLATTAEYEENGVMENTFMAEQTPIAWFPRDVLQHQTLSSAALGTTTGKGNWSEVFDGILYVSAHRKQPESLRNILVGKLQDARTKEALSFASISIEQTTRGTAANAEGIFQLNVKPEDAHGYIRISNIGYKSRRLPIDSLLKKGRIGIDLQPESELLLTVTITAKAPDAQEILRETLKQIPQNYQQNAFNMEFYSTVRTYDSITHRPYKLETIIRSYYEGYKMRSLKNFKLIHKRESGEDFTKHHGARISRWAPWPIFRSDVYATLWHDGIFEEKNWRSMKPKLDGYDLYEGDTVFIIGYQLLKGSGTLFISTQNYAILKHTIDERGKGFYNLTEIAFKKSDGYYYPYIARAKYDHQHKIDEKKRFIRIENDLILTEYATENVEVINGDANIEWDPDNIGYDQQYWDSHYPQKN